MSKYICVENFLKYIDDTICKGCREDGKDANGIVCRACQIMDMLDYVDDFPAADVEPVKCGKWEVKQQTKTFNEYMTISGKYPTCNLCGFTEMGFFNETNYCPNCGAKMDKE